MKKINFILSFILSAQVNADQKSIQTPFWKAIYSEQSEIQMRPVLQGLESDCKQYADYLMMQAHELTAEDLDFARTLPLRKQMKDNYEVDFQLVSDDYIEKNNEVDFKQINDPVNISHILNYQIENPIVSLDLSSLKNIKWPVTEGSLSAISKKLGLAETPVELVQNKAGAVVFIKVKGRDVVCDLLNKNFSLMAEALYVVSLRADNILKMNNFYKKVEDKVFEIFSQDENKFVKAALLGYAYGQLYEEENLPEVAVRQNILFLFKNLFRPNSLELNENWLEIGNQKVIHYEKSKTTGYGPVILRMQAI